jgi:hypothetical protein
VNGPCSIRLAILGAVLCSGGCLGAFEPEVGELRAGVCTPEDSDPAYDVSFGEDVFPLFERMSPEPGCGCHLPSSRRPIGIELSGLDLGSYSSLMRGGTTSADAIVVPGDPCASVLVQKLSSAPPFGARMPSSGPPYLSPDERALIADWIAEGAHDN